MPESFGIQHFTTKRWLSTEGTAEANAAAARIFGDRDSADAHRVRVLESFADAWTVQPLPTPEP